MDADTRAKSQYIRMLNIRPSAWERAMACPLNGRDTHSAHVRNTGMHSQVHGRLENYLLTALKWIVYKCHYRQITLYVRVQIALPGSRRMVYISVAIIIIPRSPFAVEISSIMFHRPDISHFHFCFRQTVSTTQ